MLRALMLNFACICTVRYALTLSRSEEIDESSEQVDSTKLKSKSNNLELGNGK